MRTAIGESLDYEYERTNDKVVDLTLIVVVWLPVTIRFHFIKDFWAPI